MRIFETLIVTFSMASLIAPSSAVAQTVLQFHNRGGWVAGQSSAEQCQENICVKIVTRQSELGPDKFYAVAHYVSPHRAWCGGSRISSNYPSESFFRVRAAPQHVFRWGEHLQSGIETIYVYVREEC